MRLFKRSQEDKFDSLNRCFFDANHGRVKLAIDRLEDLSHEFPEDAKILYAEGLIRKDHLGQGVNAYTLFKKAFEVDNTHIFAAINATCYSPYEQQFRQWATIVVNLTSCDKSTRRAIDLVLTNLDKGVSYWEILYRKGRAHFEANQFGDSAALIELALLTSKMTPMEEVVVRRGRAQSIRTLDANEAQYRATILESFPPEERIALREALTELDRAIALDEYDAELWNLKSSWCNNLTLYEAAIRYADRASKLRPFQYAKPHMNKALALKALKKDHEALTVAREALKQAESSSSVSDMERSRQMVKDFSSSRRTPTLRDSEPIISQMIRNAKVTSSLEMGELHSSADKLTDGLLNRSRFALDTMGYVQIMAELLSGVTPETTFYVVLKAGENNPRVRENCFHGALYVAAHSDGVQQRDAARFLVLSILEALYGLAIRQVYRESILAVSTAATDEMSRLDQILREELRCMNPFFPQLIANQPPVNKNELEQATRNILSKFNALF